MRTLPPLLSRVMMTTVPMFGSCAISDFSVPGAGTSGVMAASRPGCAAGTDTRAP